MLHKNCIILHNHYTILHNNILHKYYILYEMLDNKASK